MIGVDIDLILGEGRGVRKVVVAEVRDMHESTGAAAAHWSELLLWGGGLSRSGINLFWSWCRGLKSARGVGV